jgi:hypothetical protein
MRSLPIWLLVVSVTAIIRGALGGELQDGNLVHFGHEVGPYTDNKYVKDFGKPEYVNMSRAEILEESPTKKVLRITTPAGAWGSRNSGGSLKTSIPPRDEYDLEYQIRFGHANGTGFDFNKGGKLPGLAGGRCNTGGVRPTGDGWSARYMWRREGALVIYLYHLDQKGDYGEDLPLDVKAQLGKWYKLRQYIRLNNDGKNDGILKIWVNGKLVLERNDIRYRLGSKALIDHFLFSHFWGGNDNTWAPGETSSIYFNDFRSWK